VISANLSPRLLLIEPPGRVRAASATHEGRAGESVEEALGVDWPTLQALARTTQRVDGSDRRIRLEPLLGQGGNIEAVLATDEGPFFTKTITSIPPSSSRWGKDLTSVVGKDKPHSAEHGMLFVEDVQELDLEQGKRLAREIDRGSLAETHFVCSVPADVRERVARGEMARELLALVRGTTVTIPPLREREDLEYLVTRMLEDIGRDDARVTPAALRALASYHFPRNLAELFACLEHAAVVAGSGRDIDVDHLPRGIFDARPEAPSGPGGLRRSAERVALEEALRGCAGNVSAAAKRLGVARSTLYRLMRRHGIDR